MSLDRISLAGLRVFARHGVREHERQDGQEFIIDAVLRLDTRAAAADDDLSLTVDYGAVADRLVRLAEALKWATDGLANWWYDHPEAPLEVLVESAMDLCWRGIERAREGEDW